MLSTKQHIIVNYLKDNETITFDKVVELTCCDVFRNQKKYASEIIGRLRKRKVIEDVKKGVYKLATPKAIEPKAVEQDNGNFSLF